MPSVARLEFKPGAVPLFANAQALKLVRKTTAETNRLARRKAPGGLYSTGALKASVRWKVTLNQPRVGVRAESGSELPYAWLVHQGVQPHAIYPRTAPRLRFFWRRVGRWVSLPSVRHPGQQAQPFLVQALIEVAPRHGFKVVIF